jgi:hypothetical protein
VVFQFVWPFWHIDLHRPFFFSQHNIFFLSWHLKKWVWPDRNYF